MRKLASRLLASTMSLVVATEPLLAADTYIYRHVPSASKNEVFAPDPSTVKGKLEILAPAEVRARPGVRFGMSLEATNADGAVTWEVKSGSLPAGLTLTSDGHVLGTPVAPIRATGITVSATDAAGKAGTSQSFVIDVKPLPIVTLDVPSAMKAGQPLAVTPRATEVYGSQVWALAQGTLPVGVGVDPVTGKVSGSPEQKGTFANIVLSVTDVDGATGYSPPLTVSVDSNLSIAGLRTAYTVRTGQAIPSIRPYATGVEGTAAWDFSNSAGAPPSWLALDRGTGALSGTPPEAGSAPNMALRVSDSGSGSTLTSPGFGIAAVAAPTLAMEETYTVRNGRDTFDRADIRIQAKAKSLIGEGRYFLMGALPDGFNLSEGGYLTGSTYGGGMQIPGLRIRAIDLFDGAQVVSNAFSLNVLPPLVLAAPGDRNPEKGWAASIAPPDVQNLVGTATWKLNGPALPDGLRFDPATGEISGTPTKLAAAQSYSYTLTDSHDGGKVNSPGFTLTVRDATPLAVLPVGSRSLRAGRILSITPQVEGRRGDLAWSVKSGTLPAWATFDPATGRISGIPSGKGGFGPVVLSVADSVLAKSVDSDAFSVTVNPADEVAIAVGTVPPARQAAPFALQPTVTNAAGPVAVTLASGKLPDGLALNASTGRIEGTPRVTGTFAGIVLAVTDGLSRNATAPFSLAVAPGIGKDGEPLGASIKAHLAAEPGAILDASPVATGFEGPLTWTLATGRLPAWAGLDASTGRISGKAVAGAWDGLSLMVKDAAGNGAVTNGFDLSAVESQILTAEMDASVPLNLGQYKEARASVRNNRSAVTWRISGRLPEGFGLDANTGVLFGTPTESGYFPGLVLTATEANGGSDATDAFSVNVSKGGLTARVTAPSYDAPYGAAFATPSPTVGGAVGELSWTLPSNVTLPSWARLDASTGAVTGTPKAASDLGTSSPIVIRALTPTQETLTAPAFTVSVARPQLKVKAYAPTVAARVGSPLDARPEVAGNVGSLSWTLDGTLPEGLRLDAVTGAIVGTPIKQESATNLVLRAVDAFDGRDAASAPFSVSAVLKPSALNVTGPGDQAALNGDPFASKAPKSSDAYGAQTWTAKSALPSWLRLDGATGVLTGTPPSVGDVTDIVLSVVDADGVPGETAPFAVRTGPNLKVGGIAASLPATAHRTFASPAPTVANATGSVTYALKSGTLPEGLSLASATGVVSGTPESGGTASGLVLRATDARGDGADTAPFSIVVAGLAVTDVASAYTAYAGSAYDMKAPVAVGGQGVVSWSLASGTKPAWAEVDPRTGRLVGTPTVVGQSSGLQLLATDAAGNTAKSKTFSLTVDSRLSVGRMQAAYTFPVGERLALAAPSVSGAVGAPAWTLSGTLPAWLAFDGATGALSGTPPAKGSLADLALNVGDATGKTLPAGTFSVAFTANIKVENVRAGYPARIKVPFASDAPSALNASGAVRWSLAGPDGVVPAAPTDGTAAPSLLPTWASFNPATGVISGTPVAGGGSGRLVLVATDAAGDTGRSAPFVVAVSNGLDVSDVAASYPARVDVPVTVAPRATGSAGGLSWSLFSGNLPTWAALDPATGRITGTPTGSGTISGLILKVADAQGLEGYSSPFSLVVGPAFGITNVADTVPAKVGVAVAVAPAAANAVGAVSWSVEGTLPSWATFTASSGRIAGIPTAAGDTDLTLVASDAGGGLTRRTFKLSVARNIVVTGPGASFAPKGGDTLATPAPQTQYAVGAVRWTVGSGAIPAWAALSETDGVVSGKADRPGTSTFTLRVTDAQGTTGESNPIQVVASTGFSVSNASAYDARVKVQGSTTAPGVTGATLPVRWTSVGTLPAWATLAEGTGVVSGTPTQPGPVEGIVLRATDAKGLQGYTSPFSILVAKPMTVSGLSETYSVRNGGVLSVYPVANDGIGAVAWSKSGAPAWMELAANGTLSGRAPSVSTTQNVVLTATDSRGFSAPGAPFAVTVTAGPAISGVAPTYEGRSGYDLPAIAPTVANVLGKVEWSANGLPTGMGIDAATGKVTGKPSVSGTFPVTVSAKDLQDGAVANAATTISLSRSLAVTGVPSRMVARTNQDFMGRLPGILGQRGSLTWSAIGTLPTWALVTESSGAVTGRPTSVGSTPDLRLQALDSTDHVTAASDPFTLDVLDPVGIADLPTSIIARFGFDFVTATPRLLNGVGAVTWAYAPGVTAPTWLTVNGATGALTGKSPDTLGTLPSVRLVATDSTGASATSVSVGIEVYAQAKVTVTAQNIQNRVGDTVTITPQQQGIVGTPAWSLVATSGTLPAGLVADPVTGKVTSKVTGTGNAEFVVRVTDSKDGRSFDSDKFSIVTRPAFQMTGIASAYRVRVNAFKATDAPIIAGARSPVTYALSIAPPTGMTFNQSGSEGILSGIPKAQASYSSVTLTATDPTPGDVRTATAVFALDILGPMTVNGVSSVSVRSAGDVGSRSYTPTAVNALDPTKVVWSLATGTLPGTLAVDRATGKLTGVAPTVAGATTTGGLSLLAVDADGSQVQSTPTFGITVNPVLDFTVANQSATEGKAFTYTVQKTGLVGTATWSATGLPTGMTISNAGVISGNPPAPGTASPYTVTVSLKDSADPAGEPALSKTFALAVAASPILSVSTASLTLGDQFMPDTTGACSTVTVTNNGSVATTDLAGVVVSPNDAYIKTTCAPTVSASVPLCTAALAPTKSCAMGVSVGGTAPGTYSGTLQVTAGTAAQKTVALTGIIRPAFEAFTFSNCTKTGQYGPTYAQCKSAYSSVAWTQDSTKFTVVGDGKQRWTVPVTGNYTFVVKGAEGGTGTGASGGRGATTTVTTALTKGDYVTVVVGQKGDGAYNGTQGGGGGGTYVYSGKGLIAASGGGGGGGEAGISFTPANATSTNTGGNGDGSSFSGAGGTNGNGGAGSYGGGGGAGYTGAGGSAQGVNLGVSTAMGTGGSGNSSYGNGGYGGGGGAVSGGGGGGGYSGGGGGGINSNRFSSGGGGGSYVLSGGTVAAGNSTGNGSVSVNMQ